MVALACIGNVGIQEFSCAGGRLYFIRRLQVYLFIIFHVQPISQGVTLLFFFTEKKKRSKKRKAFRLPLFCKATYYTIGSVTPQSSLRLASSSAEEPYIEISSFLNKNPPEGS